MGYTYVDYTNMTENERITRALQDCKDYLGEEDFNRLVEECKKEPPMPFNQWRLLLEFRIGIAGPPVRILYNHIWPQNFQRDIRVVEPETSIAKEV